MRAVRRLLVPFVFFLLVGAGFRDDKLVEIEGVLTKDQLVQLREIRQTAPIALRATAARTTPVTTK